MRASGASAIKRTDRRAVGIECQGCQRMFPSSYAYDQHRRSGYLRGTACYAYPDEMRTTVTAGPRPNMSTATVERRTGQRMRGRIAYSAYWIYYIYSAYQHKVKSQNGSYRNR